MTYTKSLIGFFILAIFLTATASSCGALSKVKGSIGGTVYVNDRPEANATVMVFTENDEFVKQERCNNTGHYTIKDLSPGRYILNVLNARGNAYEGDTIVEVRIGKFETVDIKITIDMGGTI